MTFTPRIPKKAAFEFAIKNVPQYVELLRDFQKGGGRFQFTPDIESVRQKFGPYVRLYEDETKLNITLAIGILGEEALKEIIDFLSSLPPEAVEEAAELFLSEFLPDDFEFPRIPTTEKEKAEALALYEQLSPEDKQKVVRRGMLFFGASFASFFNILSVMIHGAKLTSLVPLALNGDDSAFLKAVQIDRLLLLHHPYFRDRKQRAQDEGDLKFLSKLGYRERNAVTKGRIRYPGLYILFACLDAAQFLDDLPHSEILDLCDEAKLDRYQNRIEDVNYVTKRLKEYRRWQKSGGLSMH